VRQIAAVLEPALARVLAVELVTLDGKLADAARRMS
jgi:hypothetical protein